MFAMITVITSPATGGLGSRGSPEATSRTASTNFARDPPRRVGKAMVVAKVRCTLRRSGLVPCGNEVNEVKKEP